MFNLSVLQLDMIECLKKYCGCKRLFELNFRDKTIQLAAPPYCCSSVYQVRFSICSLLLFVILLLHVFQCVFIFHS